jgi:ERCC4-related helicase
VRILVSTNALEEGIDVSDCEFVVRYNRFSTTKSHIQGAGRARFEGAKVFYFENDPDMEQEKADMLQVRDVGSRGAGFKMLGFRV